MASRLDGRTDRRLGAAPPRWYRDPYFHIAVLATLALKLLWLLLLITVWKRTSWVDHLKYDLSTWREFFDHIRQGGIPYVDFSREYPVGIGLFYWLLSPLFRGGEQQALIAHAAVMVVFDVLNAALFYPLARAVDRSRALWGTLLWSLGLTSLVLSPLRFEAVLVTTLLVGYRCHLRGKYLAASMLWSLGASIKWFPALLFGSQELTAFFVHGRRSRWWRAALVFGTVQALINVPILVAGWLRHHTFENWSRTYLYHLDRPLSVDTLAGMAQLWLGYLSWEGWLAPLSLGLVCLVLVLRPSLPLARKAVLLTIAIVICNRIYSPQFHLWCYPFLILHLLGTQRTRSRQLTGLYVLLEICNVLVYPFAFSRALDEMGSFSAFAAADHGGVWTVLWSACIIARCVILLILTRLLLQAPPRQAQARVQLIAAGTPQPMAAE